MTVFYIDPICRIKIAEHAEGADAPEGSYPGTIRVVADKLPDPITSEYIEELSSVVPETDVVPQSVTNAQARAVLRASGLLATVQAGLEALPEPQRAQILDVWEYSPYFNRSSSLIETLGTSFGLDDAALDTLFKQAAAITF